MSAFAMLNVWYVTSLILIVFSLVFYLARYLKKTYTYWERRGVPYVKPIPIFGNSKDLLFRRVPVAFFAQRMYNKLDGHKFGGLYLMTKPSVLIRDPQLLRAVLVKNFSNFHDRLPPGVDVKTEPLHSHLVNLTGERWRNIRYKLTPTFSSSKLRQMENLMEDCIGELDEYLRKITSGDSKTRNIVDLKEVMSKFATDVIGTCAFGFRCNSIRDEHSEFRRIGRLFVTPTYRRHAGNVLKTLSPRLANLINFNSLNPEVMDRMNLTSWSHGPIDAVNSFDKFIGSQQKKNGQRLTERNQVTFLKKIS